ncbi:MAG: hypothetical protein II767_07950 [Proteobacteria bacterium]|nr:hypothetical protein [Pseudomonadota bacterium]MBQ4360174.1 hypothetical protein [Pseudomonadota bacterium]
MPHHQIIIACRDNAEAEVLRSAAGQPSASAYHKASSLLDHLAVAGGSFLVMTPLIMDETATGILTKVAIIQPSYSILYARHADRALNVLRLFGCGCSVILGPNELEDLPKHLEPDERYLDALVMPPFFIDDDESSLKEPPSRQARPLHVTFLGAQGVMSCANALLNIHASGSLSMSCVAPQNAWARDHFIQSLEEYTLWKAQTKPAITASHVTLCSDFKALATLEPTSQHFVICHGLMSEAENAYLERLPEGARVFVAAREGYTEKIGADIGAMIDPERLWDILISALYAE